jgi:hypothetical protein
MSKRCKFCGQDTCEHARDADAAREECRTRTGEIQRHLSELLGPDWTTGASSCGLWYHRLDLFAIEYIADEGLLNLRVYGYVLAGEFLQAAATRTDVDAALLRLFNALPQYTRKVLAVPPARKVPCDHCGGRCCALERREGTVRYANLLHHGEGVHFCRHCSDGTVPPLDTQKQA